MAVYGRGQTLGSGINPESFKQDYSGFTNAAAIQAQGMANLGAQIGQATGDYFKQQNEKKKAIKQASTQIESALNLFPDLKSTFSEAQNRLRDDDIPLSERAAEAETIAGLINMGVTKLRDQAEKDLQLQKINASRGATEKPFTLKPDLLNVGGGFVAVKTGSDGNYYDESGQFPITNMQAYIGGEPPESYSSFAASVPNYGSEGDLPAGMIDDVAPMVLPVEGFGNNVDPASIDYAANLGGPQATPADIQGAQMASPVVGEPPASIAAPQSAPARRSRLIQKDAESSVPAGSEMTMGQYNSLVAQGQNIKGVPLSNGNVFVTAMQPFAPQQGQEIITNADGTTVRSIAVGSGAKAASAEKERVKQQSGFVEEFTKTAAETLNMLPNLPDTPVGAKVGAVLGEMLPATEAGRVVSRLNTLKANLALDKINQMRAASPTGGAAGNMTEKEWPLFMQEFGALDAAENKQDLAARLKNASVKLFDRVNGTPEERAAALEKGVITKEDNDIVEKEYTKMLSSIGIRRANPEKRAASNPFELSPSAKAAKDKLEAEFK
jgi:hypothetical protein